jgi:hypothetical protein
VQVLIGVQLSDSLLSILANRGGEMVRSIFEGSRGAGEALGEHPRL